MHERNLILDERRIALRARLQFLLISQLLGALFHLIAVFPIFLILVFILHLILLLYFVYAFHLLAYRLC